MLFLAVLRVFAAAIVVAPTPAASPTTPPEITHVVTSDRTDETLRNSVRTTFVVTASDIARYGYRSVSDAIANVPGVQINSYGTIGAAADYGIRGSSSAQVLVLMDGEPAPGGFANSVQLGNMSTAGVERIEVVEGGGSTLYGTGAIGGIINVITNNAHVPADATLRYGSFDNTSLQVDGDGLSLERIVSHNVFALPSSMGEFGPNPTLHDNSDFESTTARYGTSRRVGALDVAFNASLGGDDLGAAGIFPDYSSTSREHDVNESGTLTVSSRRSQSDATLSLFGSTQQITYGCDAAKVGGIPVDANCFQEFTSLSTETRTGLGFRDVVTGAAERTIYGIDVSRGTVRADDGFADLSFDALAQSAAYVQQNWIGAHDEFYAGIRGERDGALGGEFSPSFGARFDLSPPMTLKLNVASAFRAPNASELYFPGYGSVAQNLGLLQPERAQVGDITLLDSRILGGASFGWFDNYTRDLIVATCVSNCNPLTAPAGTFPDYAPQNVDLAHMAGFTFDTQTVPLNGVSVTVAATDLYLAQDVASQMRLPNDPVLNVNLGLVFTGNKRSFVSEAGIAERVVGSRGPVDTTQPPFYQAAPYSDLTAFASFRISSRALLTVRGFNLGNEQYAAVSGYPMPGRTFALELNTH